MTLDGLALNKARPRATTAEMLIWPVSRANPRRRSVNDRKGAESLVSQVQQKREGQGHRKRRRGCLAVCHPGCESLNGRQGDIAICALGCHMGTVELAVDGTRAAYVDTHCFDRLGVAGGASAVGAKLYLILCASAVRNPEYCSRSESSDVQLRIQQLHTGWPIDQMARRYAISGMRNNPDFPLVRGATELIGAAGGIYT